MVVTFYSFKGGVGRSMAMVNVGQILADFGYSVVLWDWDLEAPGLERYVTERTGWDHLTARPGTMDLLREYKGVMSKKVPAPDDASAGDAFCRVGKVLLRRPSTLAIDVSLPSSPGRLRVLTAGARGPDDNEQYSHDVQTFDWDSFYRQWAGGAYIDFLKRDLSKAAADAFAKSSPGETVPPGAADIVLVDSRTGVTEHGGVTTHHLADLVVLLSAANDQNLRGIRWMADALGPRLRDAGEATIPVLPVRARIEQTAEHTLTNAFRARFNTLFSGDLPKSIRNPKAFMDDSEIPYKPFYSFEERIAAREPEDDRDSKLLAAYREIANGIVACGIELEILRPLSNPGLGYRPPSDQLEEVEAHRGLFTVCIDESDATWAGPVEASLRNARLRVTHDPLGGAARANGEQDAGLLLFVGPQTPEPWVRAHFDHAVRRTVAQPDFIILPVLSSNAVLDRMPYLARTRVAVADDPTNSHLLVLFELSLRRTVPREPSTLCPFPGNRPFAESEARFFFGRDAQLLAFFNRCTDTSARWMKLEAAAGAGLSSFINAGVIPAIRRGCVPRVTRNGPVVWRPASQDAVASFRIAITTALDQTPEQIAEAFDSGPDALARILRDAGPRGRSVIILDDLEPVLAVPRSPEIALLDQLLANAVDSDAPLLLITAVRPESVALFADAFPALHRTSRQTAFTLEPLTHAQMIEAGSSPARLAGLDWERGLLERIVDDISETHAPVAFFADLLASMWSSRVDSVMTSSAYHKYGTPLARLAGILRERIERLTAEHDSGKNKPDVVDRVRRIVLALIKIDSAGGYAARSVPLDHVLSIAGRGTEADAALSALSAHPSLVTLDRNRRLSLVHEALIRQSPQIAEWTAASRRMLERRDDLLSLVASWRRGNRTDLLARIPTDRFDDVVEEAGPEAIAAVNEALAEVARQDEDARRARERAAEEARKATERANVEADRASRRARTGRIRRSVLVLAVLTLVAGISYLITRARNTEAAADLSIRAAQQIGATEPNSLKALLLAAEAARRNGSVDATQTLRQALGLITPRALLQADQEIVDADMNAGGTRVVTLSSDGGIIVWDPASSTRVAQMTHADATQARFLPDDRVVSINPRELRLWRDNGTYQNLEAREGIFHLAVSGGAPWVAASTILLNRPLVWRAGSELAAVSLSGDQSEASFVGWTSDGSILLVTSSEGVVRLFNPEQGRQVSKDQVMRGAVPEHFNTGAISANGAYVAAGGEGVVYLWSVRDGQLTSPRPLPYRDPLDLSVTSLSIDQAGVRDSGLSTISRIAFSPDGAWLLAAGNRGIQTWRTADPGNGSLIIPPPTSTGITWVASDAAFSPDNSLVVGAGNEGLTYVWDRERTSPARLLKYVGVQLKRLDFSRDGQSLLTIGADATAVVWDMRPQQSLESATLADLLSASRARVPAGLSEAERQLLVARE